MSAVSLPYGHRVENRQTTIIERFMNDGLVDLSFSSVEIEFLCVLHDNDYMLYSSPTGHVFRFNVRPHFEDQ